jgi:tetratricopeptide (TPR) repeat protein
LARFQDATWRQVVLFLIGTLSERRSVVPELLYLRNLEPPYGLALAAVAISEGANVDTDFKVEVISALCEDIRINAKGSICPRLLTTGDNGSRTRAALIPFMGDEDLQPYIRKLEDDLTVLAYEYGHFTSCAIEDLGALHAENTLIKISSDSRAPIQIRTDAIAKLCALGRHDFAYNAFVDLAGGAALDSTQWTILVKRLTDFPNAELSSFADAEVFATLSQHNCISNTQWGKLLDSLTKEDKWHAVLELLATNPQVPANRRLAIQVRTIHDRDEVLRLLPTLAGEPEAVQPCIELLIRKRDREALLEIATGSAFAIDTRVRAVRALKAIEAFKELTQIFESSDVPYVLRRRSAEAIYRSTLDVLSAKSLLRFFESLGQRSNKPPILHRLGYLQYYLDESDDALSSFNRLFDLRPGTPFELSILAHCLERLRRVDEALAEYTKATDLQPALVFARRRRAFIHWQRDEFVDALPDVKAVKSYNSPDWFQPYAADILRACGRFDVAKDWLAAARQKDPESAIVHEFSAALAFDRGQFGAAIDDLKSAIKQDASHVSARYRLANILRVAGRFEPAAHEYTNLLSDLPDDWNVLSARAQVLLRVPSFSLADRDIASLRSNDETDPWYIYILMDFRHV